MTERIASAPVRYLELVEGLRVPNVCVVGNHDLDSAAGPEAWARVHGPMNFDFAYGHTHFVVLNGAPGEVGEVEIDVDVPVEGPREDALEFLDHSLEAAEAPHRVVLTHMPPHLDGHPRRGLVCCAHGLAFDHHVHGGIHFVMSGGGGTGLCSDFRGICAGGEAHPEDRGSLFHVVQVEITEDGAVSGKVLQAFETGPGRARIRF